MPFVATGTRETPVMDVFHNSIDVLMRDELDIDMKPKSNMAKVLKNAVNYVNVTGYQTIGLVPRYDCPLHWRNSPHGWYLVRRCLGSLSFFLVTPIAPESQASKSTTTKQLTQIRPPSMQEGLSIYRLSRI